jgi:hypothetical protein
MIGCKRGSEGTESIVEDGVSRGYVSISHFSLVLNFDELG